MSESGRKYSTRTYIRSRRGFFRHAEKVSFSVRSHRGRVNPLSLVSLGKRLNGGDKQRLTNVGNLRLRLDFDSTRLMGVFVSVCAEASFLGFPVTFRRVEEKGALRLYLLLRLTSVGPTTTTRPKRGHFCFAFFPLLFRVACLNKWLSKRHQFIARTTTYWRIVFPRVAISILRSSSK